MTDSLGKIDGIPVMVENSLGWEWEQVRFPRSKKRRIRKKWTKRRSNWCNVQTKSECYKMAQGPRGFVIICSPAFYARLKTATAPLDEP